MDPVPVRCMQQYLEYASNNHVTDLAVVSARLLNCLQATTEQNSPRAQRADADELVDLLDHARHRRNHGAVRNICSVAAAQRVSGAVASRHMKSPREADTCISALPWCTS